jgi:DNA-directed RNA polymerase subunit M/transcription elongation factor TFIIS
MSRATKQTVQALLLTHTAEVKEVHIALGEDGTITMKAIQAALKKKTAPEMLGSYKYKSIGLFLFGYLAGKAGQENKHELPPPHDTTLAFGDILLVGSKDTKSWMTPTPFKVDDYEAFYTKAFGGFEGLDDDDEGDEEEDVIEDTDDVEGVNAEVEADADDDIESVIEADDSEEEDEGVAEECEGEEVEDVPIPVAKKRVVAPASRAKKSKRAVAGVSSAAQIYTNFLHVPEKDELKVEAFDSDDFSAQAACPARMKMVAALSQLFKGYLSPVPEIQMLERCIYVASLRAANQRHVGRTWSHPPFVEIYRTVAKHIGSNLHPSSYVGNKELFERYKTGHLTFEEISKMDTYQLFEGRWNDSFVAQQVREKRQLEGNKAMATDRFLCGRCHKRECTYYEMQTRSADEPMTIFITCLNCGKHWRQ